MTLSLVLAVVVVQIMIKISCGKRIDMMMICEQFSNLKIWIPGVVRQRPFRVFFDGTSLLYTVKEIKNQPNLLTTQLINQANLEEAFARDFLPKTTI
jgi:hypothetical protein